MFGRVMIDISKDSMKAIAYLGENVKEERQTWVSTEMVLSALEEKGIKTGIIYSEIEKMVKDGVYRKPYVVAVGKYPIKGEDGYYKYYFNTNTEKSKPALRADGTVDYSVQRELTSEGTLLAEYFPAKKGVNGYTVFDTVVAPVPSRELPPFRTIGVVQNENAYYAATNGQIILDEFNGELSVIDSLVIHGDCGYGTGDINFFGDLQITGDVKSGVHIFADGNITIKGIVEGATIEAGKDLIIKKGVHGKSVARLKAGGSVYAEFIAQATVEAGKSIVADSIINCNTYANGTICAKGKNGLIMGGVATSADCVEAKVVSNENGIKTVLSVKPPEEGDEELCKVIVHQKAYDGTRININGVDVNMNIFENGELHLMADGIRKYTIGTFVPTPKPPKPVEETAEKPRKLVLIVDDEPLILKTFFEFLHEDYNVAAVNSARDAFRFMEKVIPDIILLDYMMPHMNGGEMLRIMRDSPDKAYYNVPVYFVTSVMDKDIVLKCLAMYPQGYLIKPLGKEEMLQVVDSYFESQE